MVQIGPGCTSDASLRRHCDIDAGLTQRDEAFATSPVVATVENAPHVLADVGALPAYRSPAAISALPPCTKPLPV